MKPSEITIFEREINEFIFMYQDNFLQSASVKAYINNKGNPERQYLKVTISSIYLVDAMIDFTVNDFRRLLFYPAKRVITDKIVDVLNQLTTGDGLLRDMKKYHGDEFTDEELDYKVNTDKVFLGDIKDNLLIM